jgi:serine/threonine-protein kinase HSL1 (negative regulator of Swe1 kinase)
LPISSAKSSLLQSPRGEVKGWFSNLFHWKTHAYGLHAGVPPIVARAEIERVLLRVHPGLSIAPALTPAPVSSPSSASGTSGALQCTICDAYDSRTGALLVKAVRFRVEFVPMPDGTGCSVVLVQEKGALGTLRAVYGRVRDEWQFGTDVTGTPGFEMVEREDVMDVCA